MAEPPRLTVTAMGHKRSGKTTFLLGMYAELSAGKEGYFLSATNTDIDLRLASRWEKLLDDGVLPPPNPNSEINYTFQFLDGLLPLLDVDWLDYRGGAINEEREGGEADVGGVLDRLVASDSIYLVIDGRYLAEPITARNRMGVIRAAGLRRMTNLLQDTIRRRGRDLAPPSLVILITKADLIPRERREPMDGLINDLQQIISVAFTGGFTTLICPVMLGDFGADPGPTVEAEDIEPHNLHLPLVYSLAMYMDQLSIAAGVAAGLQRERAGQLASMRKGLTRGVGSVFRRGQASKASREADQAADELETFMAVQEVAAHRAKQLFGELSGLSLFRDGNEVQL